MGIPNAHITAFISIANNVGSNRIVSGGHFTSPAGAPDMPLSGEKRFRKNILKTAISAIGTKVEESKIFDTSSFSEEL